MVEVNKEKLKALEQAMQQIDRQFGKGALVRHLVSRAAAIRVAMSASLNCRA